MKRLKLTLALILCLTMHNASPAQDTGPMTRLRTHATLFGVGYHNLLDTYLSPSEYTGTTVRILREHNRHTRLMKGNIAMQNSLQGNLAYCKSPTLWQPLAWALFTTHATETTRHKHAPPSTSDFRPPLSAISVY